MFLTLGGSGLLERLLCSQRVGMNLLDVTQEGHSPQNPVIGGQHSPQVYHGDEGQVGTPGLLVDGAHVQLGVLGCRGVDGEDVQHGQLHEEHLGRGLRELPVASVPGGTVHVQPIDIHSFLEEPGRG